MVQNRPKALTLPEMRQHVLDLAAAFSIEIAWHDGPVEAAMACVDLRKILAPLLQGESQYAAVLHEMGHICHPSGSLRNDPGVKQLINRALMLAEEESAWEWARANALDWTVTMESVYRACISTYTQLPQPEPQPLYTPKPHAPVPSASLRDIFKKKGGR